MRTGLRNIGMAIALALLTDGSGQFRFRSELVKERDKGERND
jgi:hypothetical protein